MKRGYPWAVGAVAATLLMAFYLTIVTLAEGRTAARAQFLDDLPFLVFLFPSFGGVAGLYAAIRQAAEAARASGAMASTSTGLSSTAVVACCAHFLPTLLPIVGISAFASVLAAWKVPLLVLAIILNLGVVVYLARHFRRMKRHHADTSKGSAILSPARPEAAQYRCPMHPDVVRNSPGTCPKCKMALETQA